MKSNKLTVNKVGFKEDSALQQQRIFTIASSISGIIPSLILCVNIFTSGNMQWDHLTISKTVTKIYVFSLCNIYNLWANILQLISFIYWVKNVSLHTNIRVYCNKLQVFISYNSAHTSK
jgi:hypothetical protein